MSDFIKNFKRLIGIINHFILTKYNKNNQNKYTTNESIEKEDVQIVADRSKKNINFSVLTKKSIE
jgi:hypothetical protein